MRNETNDIEDLTKQLEALRIKREQINKEERELIKAIQRSSSLPVEQKPDETRSSTSRAATDPTGTFTVGERVLITNRITHVPFGRITLKDRAAVITKITPAGKLSLRTYSGIDTWRNPGNLTQLSEEAHNRATQL